MNESSPTSPPSRRPGLWLAVLALLIAALTFYSLRSARPDDSLLRADGLQLQTDTALLAYAVRRAEPLYQSNCASCHGANLVGMGVFWLIGRRFWQSPPIGCAHQPVILAAS